MSEASDLKNYLIQSVPPEREVNNGLGLFRELEFAPNLEALRQRLGKFTLSSVKGENFTPRFWYLTPTTIWRSEKATTCNTLTRTVLSDLFDDIPTLLTPIAATLGTPRVRTVKHQRKSFGCIRAPLISEGPSEWGHERRSMAANLAQAGIFAHMNDVPRPRNPDINLILFPLTARDKVRRLVDNHNKGRGLGEAFFSTACITVRGANGQPIVTKEQRPDIRQAIREAEQA